MSQEASITTLRLKEGRGIPLTIILVLSCIGLLISAVYVISAITTRNWKPTLFPNSPLLELLYDGMNILANTANIIGILLWKKIAVYAAWIFAGFQLILLDTFFYTKTIQWVGAE